MKTVVFAVVTLPLAILVGLIVGPLLALVFWWGRVSDLARTGSPTYW